MSNLTFHIQVWCCCNHCIKGGFRDGEVELSIHICCHSLAAAVASALLSPPRAHYWSGYYLQIQKIGGRYVFAFVSTTELKKVRTVLSETQQVAWV